MSGTCLRIGCDRPPVAVLAILLFLLPTSRTPAATSLSPATARAGAKTPAEFNREWTELAASAKREASVNLLAWNAWTSGAGTFVKLVKQFEKEFGG
jgi:hypothetical protein